jgi:integrase
MVEETTQQDEVYTEEDTIKYILKGCYPLKLFYFYLIKELGKSPSTSMQYCRCVIQMFNENKKIEEAIKEKDKDKLAIEVRKYTAEKNRKYPISALFSYFGFQYEKTKDDFFLTAPKHISFETKKVKLILKKNRTFLTKLQILDLLEHVNTFKSKYLEEIKFFIMIQFETACRGGALHKVNIKDFDWDEEQIRYWINLIEKGNKRIRLPLSRSLSAKLRAYFKRAEVKDLYRERMFESSSVWIWRIIQKAGKEKLNTSVHPHSFRRASATILYNRTKDAKLVQKVLGHSDISTTYKCYIDSIQSPEDIKLDEVEW